MLDWLAAGHGFWYEALPYTAMALLLVGFLHRRMHHPETLALVSTRQLESRLHFWTSVPLHYGVGFVLAVHLLAFLFPSFLVWWNRSALRRSSLEFLLLTAAVTALIGVTVGVRRRRSDPRVHAVTRRGDWAVLLVLAWQVVSGFLIATLHPWGSGWLAAAGAPYVRSLFVLNPDSQAIAAAPLLMRLHIVNAWILVILIPFTRLVHAILIPVGYLWRPYLVYRRRRRHAYTD
ncbi:MAG TPA: respiratory nitrate reductase subunit gamma [Acidobacteriota bacterium]|nr:respiratory nitrate reductase subunit gamma [Acidobacteriota bacterium]